ncbi:MAG: TusE/DsrC/DsvC family sulfur relay protein [bacterium]|nr:TusE/DsrC/DsvC family sulfur relay protein [bacterium]
MSFELNRKTYETDENGCLQNPEDWNKKVAKYLARGVEIDLTSEHWKVIDILRHYYQEYGYPPQMKAIVKKMEKRFVSEKANHKYFYKLFPQGPYNQAYKIAGIPMPYLTRGCEAPLIRWYLWSNTYGMREGGPLTPLPR